MLKTSSISEFTRETKIRFLVRKYKAKSANSLGWRFITGSSAPAICTNKGCNHNLRVELDAQDYGCPKCKTETVQGLYFLMGIL